MRQIFYLGFALLLVSLFACEDDFELEAPFADIPVVNAYLSIDDTDNFVRVQKAFLGAGGNALVAAQNADSLYYGPNEATVTIAVGNGDPLEMERVDGADYGILRDTGVFVNTPNWLYLVPEEADLDGGDAITVTVSRDGESDAVAKTTMLTPIVLTAPTSGVGLRLANYSQILSVRWNTNDVARIFNVRMDIRVREFDADDPSNNTTKTVSWEMARNFRRESDQNTIRLQVSNEGFWQFLGNALEEDPNIIRQFLDFDIVVTGVGGEVEEAIDLANANTGITSAQSIPVYTNVENGLGIVTSRSSGRSVGLFLEGVGFTDTLRNGVYTKDLGFQ